MKIISAIFPVHNVLPYTQQCIAMLRQYLPPNQYEIIVIDNASHDGTGKWLHLQNGLQVIRNEENMGLGASYNQGAHIARGETLLFLHNDIVFSKNAFKNMYDILYSRENIGAVGPVTNRNYFLHHHVSQQYVMATEYEDTNGLQQFADQVETVEPTKWPILFLEEFCLLAKREAFLSIGGFDEHFLSHGYGSADFCFRLQQEGYRLFCARTYVHHESGSYAKNHIDTAAIMEHDHSLFHQKWEFEAIYSCMVRKDLLSAVEETARQRKCCVLDIGCACGGNLLYLQEVNPATERYGIEINPKAASIASLFGDVRAIDLETFDEPDWKGKFDFILAGDVLEHLVDPWQTMKKIAVFLRQNGFLLMSIPNVMHISIFHSLLNGEWQYQDAGLLDRTHLRFFTKNSIMDMVQEAGLSIHAIVSSCIALTEEQQMLLQHLLALPGQSATEEELRAYQWLVAAKKA